MNLVNVSRRAKLGYKTRHGFNNAIEKLGIAKKYNVSVSSFLSENDEYLEFHRANYLIGYLSILEAYLSDTLFEYLACYPGHTNEKSVSFDAIAKAGSIAEIANFSSQKKLNELTYKKFSEFHNEFISILSIREPIDSELVNQISEIKATRDIYVHAKGVCNEVYISKSGDLARARLNEKLPLNDEYIKFAEEKIEIYLKKVYSGIPDKTKTHGRLKAFREMWEASGLASLRPFEDYWEILEGEDMARPKDDLFRFGWSGSERAAVDFFLGIYSQDHPERKTDLMYALQRWPPSTNMGRVITSWAESPFWF